MVIAIPKVLPALNLGFVRFNFRTHAYKIVQVTLEDQ